MSALTVFFIWCRVFSVDGHAGADRFREAPPFDPSLVVNGTILATSPFPDSMTMNSTFPDTLRATIAQLTSIGTECITIFNACITGCTTDARVKSINLHGEDLSNLAEFTFVLDVPHCSTKNETAAEVLRRFSGLGIEALESAFHPRRATLLHGMFRTSDEVALFVPSRVNPQVLSLFITHNFPAVLSKASADDACFLGTQEEKLRSGDYWLALMRGSLVTRQAGGNDEAEAMCRREGAALLRDTCVDMDQGITDAWGASCFFYALYGREACGDYDTAEFIASELCCACKGASYATGEVKRKELIRYDACTDIGDNATDRWQLSCSNYADDLGSCGFRDTVNFQARVMCCACGGGRIDTTWSERQFDMAGGDTATGWQRRIWVYMKVLVDVSRVHCDLSLVPASMMGASTSEVLQQEVTNAATIALEHFVGVDHATFVCHFSFSTGSLLAVFTPTGSMDVTSIQEKLAKLPLSSEFSTAFRNSLSKSVFGRDTIIFSNLTSGVHGLRQR